MFCGTGSFSHVDDSPGYPSETKGSRRKQSSSPTNSKNPYAGRGLDKFSTVLATLEARREKIMARTGPEGVSMVRFAYKNSDEWVPIIVRLRDPHQEEKRKKAIVKRSQIQQKPDAAAGKDSQQHSQPPHQLEPKAPGPVSDKPAKKSFSGNLKEGENGGVGCSWLKWRPNYYWPMVLVLILFCLVVFGRMFAICCTSIWWYSVPGVRKSTKNTDYRRRLSHKKLGEGSMFNIHLRAQVKKLEGLGSSPRNQANVKKG